MPKPEWGVKRTCPNCDERFYDLQKEPIVCPECGETYDVDAQGKVSATRERRVPVKAGVDEEDLVDDEDIDDDEDDDEALLGDDEDDEEPSSPALSDEDADEEEAVPFKDAGLVDDDEEDELDDEDDDEEADDDVDLDDVPVKGKGK